MSSPMDDPLAKLLSEVRHAITYGVNEDKLDADVRHRVLMCGSRSWVDGSTVRMCFAGLNGRWSLHGGRFTVIHGACPTGADREIDLACEIFSGVCDVERYPADWDTHGKAAGSIRNKQMLDTMPDLVVAFWDGKSRGTLDVIRQAASRGFAIRIFGMGVRR